MVLWWGFHGRQIEWHYSGLTKSKAAILENSNGDISAADRLIYSVFGSTVGFSRSADRMVLFRVGPHAIGMWKKTMREE